MQISTQAELVDALRETGFEAVQTTVSRDIAELGLVKVRAANGRLVYAQPGAADLDRLRELRRRSGAGRSRSRRATTSSSSSRRAASRPRSRTRSTSPATPVLATVAGENTILVVPAAGVRPPTLREELSRHLLEGAA